MKKQEYSNHVQYYPLHHFIFYPALTAAIFWSVSNIKKHPESNTLWIALTLVFVFIGWLSFMVRQHYGLMNQDRIVRLELRLRYYQLTQKRLEEVESKLSMKQLMAIRFASDEELPELVQKAVDEGLSPDKIKRLIRYWLPDYNRV